VDSRCDVCRRRRLDPGIHLNILQPGKHRLQIIPGRPRRRVSILADWPVARQLELQFHRPFHELQTQCGRREVVAHYERRLMSAPFAINARNGKHEFSAKSFVLSDDGPTTDSVGRL
jgi:hypothetical protein